MSAILHPSLNKNTTLHRNSLGNSRVIFNSFFPCVVRIASGRSWASSLRCDLHNPAPNQMIDRTEKPKSLQSLQNAQRDTTNSAVRPHFSGTTSCTYANKAQQQQHAATAAQLGQQRANPRRVLAGAQKLEQLNDLLGHLSTSTHCWVGPEYWQVNIMNK